MSLVSTRLFLPFIPVHIMYHILVEILRLFIGSETKKKQNKSFHFIFTYTAHGCILPTAPNNGRLVSKTDDSVKFLCDPSFVFPDTGQCSRTLYCTDRNTWHDSLPNCVGMLATVSLSLANRIDCLKRYSFLILSILLCFFIICFAIGFFLNIFFASF